MKHTNDEDNALDAQVSFRLEKEGKKAVIDFSKGFNQSEGEAWRLLAAKGLSDASPDCWKKRFKKLLGFL